MTLNYNGHQVWLVPNDLKVKRIVTSWLVRNDGELQSPIELQLIYGMKLNYLGLSRPFMSERKSN